MRASWSLRLKKEDAEGRVGQKLHQLKGLVDNQQSSTSAVIAFAREELSTTCIHPIALSGPYTLILKSPMVKRRQKRDET